MAVINQTNNQAIKKMKKSTLEQNLNLTPLEYVIITFTAKLDMINVKSIIGT